MGAQLGSQSAATDQNSPKRIKNGLLRAIPLELANQRVQRSLKQKSEVKIKDNHLEFISGDGKNQDGLGSSWKKILKQYKVHNWKYHRDVTFTEESKSANVSGVLIEDLLLGTARKFPHLKSLRLIFPHHAMNEEDVRLFSSILGRQFPNLQSLELHFNGNCITNRLAVIIGSELGHMTRLKNLSLHFPNPVYGSGKMDDNGLKWLLAPICKYLSNLTNFAIGFKSHQNIKNNGLDAVGSLIAQRRRPLSRLDLDFSGCTRITSLGVQYLLAGVTPVLKSLSQLGLRFAEYYNKKICDET